MKSNQTPKSNQFVLYVKYKSLICYIDAKTHTMGVELHEATVYNIGDSTKTIESAMYSEFGKMYKHWIN